MDMPVRSRSCFSFNNTATRLATLVLLASTPLLIVSIVGAFGGVRFYTDLQSQENERTAVQIGEAFSAYVTSLWESETALLRSECPDDLRMGVGHVRKSCLSNLLSYPAVAASALLDPTGEVVIATRGWDPSQCPGVKQAVRRIADGEEHFVTALAAPLSDGSPALVAVSAIEVDGVRIGSIAAQISAVGLRLVVGAAGSSIHSFGLIGPDGTAVVWSQDDGAGASAYTHTLDPDCAARHVLAGHGPLRGKYDSWNDLGQGDETVTVYIPELGWASYVTDYSDTAIAMARSRATRALCAVFAATIIGAVGAFIIGRRSVQHVKELERAAKAMCAGDMSARVMPRGCDEIAAAGRAFDQMAARIQDLEESRLKFMQVSTHELRNPMAAVRASAGLIARRVRRGESAEALAPLVDVLVKETDRLSELLRQVMDAFLTAQGRILTKHEPFDLRDAVYTAIAPVRMSGSGHRLVLAGCDPKSPPAGVIGDRIRIEEVIRILISNSLAYSMGHGQILVSVRVDGKVAELTVKDSGIGIPEDEVSGIFEGFARGSNLEGRDPGGLGLGLYVAAMTVRQHRGKIWVESIEGRGTTFHVELPLANNQHREGA